MSATRAREVNHKKLLIAASGLFLCPHAAWPHGLLLQFQKFLSQ